MYASLFNYVSQFLYDRIYPTVRFKIKLKMTDLRKLKIYSNLS